MNNRAIVGRVVEEEQPRQAMTVNTPADLVRYASLNGGSIADLRELMELQRQWEANEARKAFVSAMAEFKQNPPVIIKDKKVSFGAGKASYMHATIGNVVGLTVAALAKYGFSHRWDLLQKDGGMIEVTCVLTHRLGHSEKISLQAARDESGGKNNIQQMASTVTYLQRYTLLSACGLATNDQPDDDGGHLDPITAEQVTELNRLIEATKSNREKLVEFFKVKTLKELPRKAYGDAVAMLQAKQKKVSA